MSEQRSAAQVLYPNLASGAAAPAGSPSLPTDGNASSKGEGQGVPSSEQRSAGAILYPHLAQAGEPEKEKAVAPPSKEKGDWLRGSPAGGFDTSKLKLPEGAEANPEIMTDFGKVPGVTAANAQQFVDLHQRALAETSTRYWDTQQSEWEAAVKGDPEIGGEKLPAVVEAVKGLLGDRNFVDAELTNLLSTYRLGSHPAVIRFLYRVSQLV